MLAQAGDDVDGEHIGDRINTVRTREAVDTG